MTAAPLFPLAGQRIWVAGHNGMVGSAVARRLAAEPCTVLTAPRSLDLRDMAATRRWLADNRPDGVVMAAAKVGGIMANSSQPADFLYDNLMIAANVIEAARQAQVAKLLLLGSSCIYPRLAEQPIREESLLTGPLEPTNEWYAVAKIAGIKLCQAYRRQHHCDFISAMPTNLYGPGDNFDLATSHVLPALIRKAHEAKRAGADSFAVWGSGSPLREFMHVDDMADAAVFLLQHYSGELPINVGSGQEISILALAELVAKVVGFTGGVTTDPAKPDGTPRKLMDSNRLTTLGWHARIGLEDGIADAYRAYLAEA
ncbi:MAG: GDP-L-fucose synthase [Novosphingobium sp.]